MLKRRKTWVYSPPRPKKPKVPDSVKAGLSLKAQRLIDEHLRPEHVKPPAKQPQFNYISDLFTKWYQSYFYFCATYACPHPDAIFPTFETRFARGVPGTPYSIGFHLSSLGEAFASAALDASSSLSDP